MRFGTKRVLVASVIVAAAVGAGLTFAFDSSPTRPSGPAKPGYLYALDAHRGTLVRNGGPGEYDLALFGVHRTAIQFLDRPGNSVSAISVAKLLSRFFTPEGTVSAPPNAAVNALVPGRGNHQYLMGVTLLTARYDRMHAVLRFHVRLLKQGAPRNRERGRTDVVLPKRFGHASVFIDDYLAVEGNDGTVSFGYTGAVQTYVIPPGIRQISITCNAGQGGNSLLHGGGGKGGSVTAWYTVNGGDTLYVYVGGQGGNTPDSSGASGAGGFNGGGDGGYGGLEAGVPQIADTGGVPYGGPGGGGASDVRFGSDTLANRAIVCGGGGGAGPNGTKGGGGGGGGGLTGGAGYSNSLGGAGNSVPDGNPGQGGTQSAGGAGGVLDATGNFHSVTGGAGSLGSGGAGGRQFSAGGGGGGGYYGGGGGNGEGAQGGQGYWKDGGPGGGGSAFTSSGTNVSMAPATTVGNGSVVITVYTPSWG